MKIAMPKRSLVNVFFPEKGIAPAYYNDQFDLKVGDLVFVEGAFEGLRGRVTEVCYTFRIKKSEYKKVISVVQTEIFGEVTIAGGSIIAIDENVMPYEKVRTWFFPPTTEGEEEYEISVEEGKEIPLKELEKMEIPPVIRERGEDYFEEDRIVFLEIRDDTLRAIAQGSKPYEITGKFRDGKFSELLCTCPFPGTCKHEYATLLFLRETKKAMDEEYGDDFDFDYLAMMPKSVFYEYLVESKKRGAFRME